ncbi:MAG: transposase, partial [Acidobacteriota bacterium]
SRPARCTPAGMRTQRPRRLEGVSYIGIQRYFLTTCTAFRRPLFVSADIVDEVLSQIRQSGEQFGLALIAYCFMPDHLHLLVIAGSEDADATAFIKRFKQISGFAYKKTHATSLWQPGYHDRVLRDDQATVAAVRYILENPVRAGLSRDLGEYPFAGSDVYDLAALMTAWDGQAW